jgi:hypothetical protein
MEMTEDELRQFMILLHKWRDSHPLSSFKEDFQYQVLNLIINDVQKAYFAAIYEPPAKPEVKTKGPWVQEPQKPNVPEYAPASRADYDTR